MKRDYEFEARVYKLLTQGYVAEGIARALSKGDINKYKYLKVKVHRVIKRLLKEQVIVTADQDWTRRTKSYRPGPGAAAYEDLLKQQGIDLSSIRGVLSPFVAYSSPVTPPECPPWAVTDERVQGAPTPSRRVQIHHLEYAVKRLTPRSHLRTADAFLEHSWHTRGGVEHRIYLVYSRTLGDYCKLHVTYNKDGTISAQITLPVVEVPESVILEHGVKDLKYLFWEAAYEVLWTALHRYYDIPGRASIELYLVKKPHYVALKIPVRGDLGLESGHIPLGERIWVDFSESEYYAHVETDDETKIAEARKVGDLLSHLEEVISEKVNEDLTDIRAEIAELRRKINYVYRFFELAEKHHRDKLERLTGEVDNSEGMFR